MVRALLDDTAAVVLETLALRVPVRGVAGHLGTLWPLAAAHAAIQQILGAP